MVKPVKTTAERRIAASVAQVWSVITNPYALEELDPRVSVVATQGTPGQLDFRYEAVRSGVAVITQVTDVVPEKRLTLGKMSASDGTPLGAERARLWRNGDAVDLHWTLIQLPPWYLRPFVALVSRALLPRWLAKVEAEVLRPRGGT